MAIAKRAPATWRSGYGVANPIRLLGLALRPLSAAAGWFVGSGTRAPRVIPREGWPDHELMGIISGRRDRFDGFM